MEELAFERRTPWPVRGEISPGMDKSDLIIGTYHSYLLSLTDIARLSHGLNLTTLFILGLNKVKDEMNRATTERRTMSGLSRKQGRLSGSCLLI